MGCSSPPGAPGRGNDPGHAHKRRVGEQNCPPAASQRLQLHLQGCHVQLTRLTFLPFPPLSYLFPLHPSTPSTHPSVRPSIRPLPNPLVYFPGLCTFHALCTSLLHLLLFSILHNNRSISSLSLRLNIYHTHQSIHHGNSYQGLQVGQRVRARPLWRLPRRSRRAQGPDPRPGARAPPGYSRCALHLEGRAASHVRHSLQEAPLPLPLNQLYLEYMELPSGQFPSPSLFPSPPHEFLLRIAFIVIFPPIALTSIVVSTFRS